MSVRVLLADDHRMVATALRSLLERQPDIEVVGEAADGASLLQLTAQLLPDIVITDIAMPDMNGIETTRRLLAKHPAIKVIALSAHAGAGTVMAMLDAGAVGYVVKDAVAAELVQAVQAVARNESYLSPRISKLVMDRAHPRASARGASEPRLGRRERAVLQLLAEGKSSPQIAAQLHIATGTVEAHRRNIMRKLDLHSVAELTKYAIREGLTSP